MLLGGSEPTHKLYDVGPTMDEEAELQRYKKPFYGGPEVLQLGFDLRQSDIKTSSFQMSIKRQEIKL